ncbi:MAG TPA: hypothetical protein PK467_08575 [Candidatus Wallbacteria bacterium]|nr:hypothetical protein [Candidatus Wallbacteria bacterium]
MSIIKKAAAIVVGASLFASAGAYAADQQAVTSPKIDISGETSKHYDPAHVGHSHQCNRCKKTYNQQGDNGPYSQGSNICPYCGFANPVPPSPNNPYTPPTPQPQPPYYPPAPQPPSPYYPPAPQPGYGENVDELIRLWDRASDYRTGDNIIVAGASRVTSLKGICRLAVKAYYNDSFNSIIANANRQNLSIDVTPEEIIYFWDKCSQYDKADALALAAVRRLNSVKAMLRVTTKFYYVNSAKNLLDYVDSMFGRLYDPPSVSDLKIYWNKASNYEIADRILLTGARYMRSVAELAELANKAYYQSTTRAIEAMYSYIGQAPYVPPVPGPQYPYGQFGSPRAYEKPLEESLAGTSKKSASVEVKQLDEEAQAKIAEAKAALDASDTSIDLSADDINTLNMEKINKFTQAFSEKKLKDSDLLRYTKVTLVKRLKEASLTNPELRSLLERMK